MNTQAEQNAYDIGWQDGYRAGMLRECREILKEFKKRKGILIEFRSPVKMMKYLEDEKDRLEELENNA